MQISSIKRVTQSHQEEHMFARHGVDGFSSSEIVHINLLQHITCAQMTCGRFIELR